MPRPRPSTKEDAVASVMRSGVGSDSRELAMICSRRALYAASAAVLSSAMVGGDAIGRI
jgi:hypothetical protein